MALEVVELLTTLKADISAFSTGMDTASRKSQGLADTIKNHSLAIGGAMTGLGATLEHFADPIEKSKATLEAVLTNAGTSFDEMKSKIDDVGRHMETFGHGTADTDQAIAILTTKFGDANKAVADMGLVAEVAAYKHISLAAAAGLVGKVADGNGKYLKQFGITVSATGADSKALAADLTAVTKAHDAQAVAIQKLADLKTIDSAKTKLTVADTIALRNAQEKVTTTTDAYNAATQKAQGAQDAMNAATKNAKDPLAQLSDKLKGIAEGQAATFGGKMEALKVKMEDFAGTVGAKVGPALTVAGPLLMGLGQTMNAVTGIVGHFKTAQEVATTATEGLTAATEAQDVAEGIALGPILLIIAAVAVIGVAIYELATHWSTVWNAIKVAVGAAWDFIKGIFDKITGAASTAFDWLKDNWPLILAILTGPFGLAVLAISDNWDKIVGFVEAIPGRIAGVAATMWDAIKNAFTDVKNWISDRIGDVVGFFTGLPGRLVSAFGDGFRFIKDKIVDAKNWLHDRIWDVIGFFQDLPGKIAGAAGDVFAFIRNGATDAKNWVSDRVNDIISFFKSIPGKLGGLPGDILKAISGPVGGVVSGVISKIGGLFAEGGVPPIGVPSIVGERGPELFVPKVAGQIIPNSVFAGGGGGGSGFASAGGSQGGGGVTHIHLYLDGHEVTEVVYNGLLTKQRTTGNLGFKAA